MKLGFVDLQVICWSLFFLFLSHATEQEEETGLVASCHAAANNGAGDHDHFASARALFLQNIERLVKDFYAVIVPPKQQQSSRLVHQVSSSSNQRHVKTHGALEFKKYQNNEEEQFKICGPQEQDQCFSPLDPHEGMILEIYQKQKSGESTLEASYELERQVELELGEALERYSADYAYQPVLVSENTPVVLGSSNEEDGSSNENLLEETSFRGWWQWWLPLWNRPRSNDHFSHYRTDARAFAGGSHGEVWRAKRKCRPGKSNNERCQQRLILKRMDLKAGYRILEAGLRECYFGSLLAERDWSRGELFTRYLDHFFREEENRLELWIVFEDAGVSLRGFLYSSILAGDFVVYQNSWFWRQLRVGALAENHSEDASASTDNVGEKLIQSILHQILESAAVLHHQGIIHRDIKPSNILCRSNIDLKEPKALNVSDVSDMTCVLGDFSSCFDNVVADHYYTGGPSRKEQTDEYAPPEAIFGYAYENTRENLSPAFDSWSIGVVALELLLGTPSVFSVDQRTRAILTHKLQKAGATSREIKKAMYLAALSQYCIFNPSGADWPLRSGDPLHNISMTKNSCTWQNFQHALRLRDPLSLGFESSPLLLHLIWRLLAFDPDQRLTAIDALRHPYFEGMPIIEELAAWEGKAVESQMLDPRMDFTLYDTPEEFTCPKCKRAFQDWRSCHQHAVARDHAAFCHYDTKSLPTCIGSHPMLPAHAYSGHCDIQGRRETMEDFHAINLLPRSSLYAILDGHNGNFASKFVAKYLRDELFGRIPVLGEDETDVASWKKSVEESLNSAFEDVHQKLLKATGQTLYTSMQQSGTTVTMALTTNCSIIVASIGDSRAVLSSRKRNQDGNGTVLFPTQLTKDHVASDKEEKEDVEGRGGIIELVNGIFRVGGSLAISRSIGDANLAHVLSRKAHVVAFTKDELADACGELDDTIPCFLIIGSDGLWDTLSNEEAVSMVSEVIQGSVSRGGDWKETASLQRAAEALTLEAYVRGSSDNIGVYVVGLPLGEKK